MKPCLIWGRFNLKETLRKLLFSANPLPKWALEYTSNMDNMALFVMARDSWRETTQINLQGFKSSRLPQTLEMPLVNAPNYLSGYWHCCLTVRAANCMLKAVLAKLCSQK